MDFNFSPMEIVTRLDQLNLGTPKQKQYAEYRLDLIKNMYPAIYDEGVEIHRKMDEEFIDTALAALVAKFNRR
jgi:hypothetical protein